MKGLARFLPFIISVQLLFSRPQSRLYLIFSLCNLRIKLLGLASEEEADCFEFQGVIIDEEAKVVFLFLDLLLGLEH